MSSSSVPSTATVLDFICLFTHDLKRKQKRWQDGVLRYHTFNKRVMVYDDRSHFIGDAHWQGGGDLEPGDEFELDRGSAIVQVSDCTGKREQDLTELLDKRAKEVEKRRSNAGTKTPGSTAATTHTPNEQNTPHFQLRHRPLNDLVGSATRIGRAVISPRSPYQVRKMAESPAQQQDLPSEDARPSKRRRQDDSPPSKMGHARALFGTTLTLTPFSSSVSTARSQALPIKTTVKPKDTSTSPRTDLLDVPKRTGTNSEHPCFPNPEAPKISAPHQTAPRRVFTQRASLRELLAGNEQNWNEGHPQPRLTVPRNHPHVPEKARPFSPHNQDNVVSLLTQTEQSGRPDNAVQNLPRFASSQQDFGVDKPSKPLHPAPVNEDTGGSGRNRKQSAETKDDAFLRWLAQGESVSSGHQTPASPTNFCPPRLTKSRSDKGTIYHNTLVEVSHKIVQNPIQIDEDEQFHPRKVTQASHRNATLKSLGKNQATTLKTHGTKRPLSPNRELPAQTGAGEPPPAKELRTELRIRSRQRRGLLMVAQNKQCDRAESLGRSSPSLPGTGSDAHAAAHASISTIPLPEEFKMAHDDAKGTDPLPPPAKGEDSVALEHPSSIKEPCNKSADNFGSVAVEKTSDEESSEDSKPLQGLADEKLQIEDQASDNIVSEKDRVSVTLPRRTNPSRRTRGKTAQAVISDNEEEIAAHNFSSGVGDSDSQDESSSTDTESIRERQPTTRPKAKAEINSGPRITKMPRKSVKSKEIIGFTISAEEFPRTDFGIGGCGQPKVVANENMNIITENASHGSHLPLKLPEDTPIAAHQQELARESSRDYQSQRKPLQEKQHQEEQTYNEQTPQQPQTKQLPRISNPATRGKKAARKQDAAGLPPQILVQLEPSASSRIASGDSLQKPNLASDTARSEPPGFCKPNGGAWSRHAEDLLGMTRPSKAPSRQ